MCTVTKLKIKKIIEIVQIPSFVEKKTKEHPIKSIIPRRTVKSHLKKEDLYIDRSRNWKKMSLKSQWGEQSR